MKESIVTRDPLFIRWQNMVSRCYNPKHKSFEWYGGAGISVCDRWRESFFNFLRDTGVPPFKGAQLDRIDSNKNYEPENVRWVTHSRNSRNRKSNKFLTFNGETLCIADWADKIGISRKSIASRIALGWPIEEVLSPEKKHKWSRRKK